MEVTIDNFGRILIPKNIRKLLGLEPGQKLELIANTESSTLDLVLKPQKNMELIISESGIPMFINDSKESLDFDIVELIKANRSERDEKLLGL